MPTVRVGIVERDRRGRGRELGGLVRRRLGHLPAAVDLHQQVLAPRGQDRQRNTGQRLRVARPRCQAAGLGEDRQQSGRGVDGRLRREIDRVLPVARGRAAAVVHHGVRERTCRLPGLGAGGNGDRLDRQVGGQRLVAEARPGRRLARHHGHARRPRRRGSRLRVAGLNDLAHGVGAGGQVAEGVIAIRIGDGRRVARRELAGIPARSR